MGVHFRGHLAQRLAQVPGPWPWSLVPGPKPSSLVPGPWSLAPGPGPWPWLLVSGPWSLFPGPGPGSWSLAPGPWFLGKGELGLGACVVVPRSLSAPCPPDTPKAICEANGFGHGYREKDTPQIQHSLSPTNTPKAICQPMGGDMTSKMHRAKSSISQQLCIEDHRQQNSAGPDPGT